MAQIQTDTLVLTFNRLVKTGTTVESIITDEIKAALEEVAQELVGEGVVIECDVA